MMSVRIALAIGIAAALAACSTATSVLEAKKSDYKSAGQLPSLEIPPDLTTPARDNRYIVPETGKSSATLSGYQADRAQQAKTGNLAAGAQRHDDEVFGGLAPVKAGEKTALQKRGENCRQRDQRQWRVDG